MIKAQLREAATLIGKSHSLNAFTGAGISAESGIPPFRGEEGIWNKYDPKVLDINYFLDNPRKSWIIIHKLFYEMFSKAKPNPAHFVLAEWQQKSILKSLITQNIDQLHQIAGSTEITCFHGTSLELVCMECGKKFAVDEKLFEELPPLCSACNGILKPDFIFFGEGIPPKAYAEAIDAAKKTDVMLIIGTSGEVRPANQIPVLAKQNGATIIEVNRDPSHYTQSLSTMFFRGEAGKILPEINALITK